MPKTKTAKPATNAGSFNLRVGELLVKEGFISDAQLRQALEVQKKEASDASLPMGELMLKKGMVDREQLDILLNHPDLRRHLGRLLLDKGLISGEQLESCLRIKRPDEFLGQVLVRKGLLTRPQLEEFLKEQAEGVRLGELAHRLGMISEADLDFLTTIKAGSRTLGEIMCEMGFISPDDLNYILQKYGKQLKLGQIMIKQGLISQQQFKEALVEQKTTGARLGRVLLDKGLVSEEQLYLALARQYNVPFRGLAGFVIDVTQRRTLATIVSEKYSSKNKILPLELRDKVLTVAFADPEKLKSLGDLGPMYPELKIRPVLITEERFDALFKQLYRRPDNETMSSQTAARQQGIELVEIDLKEEKVEKGQVNLYGGTDMMTEQVVDFIIKYGIVNAASDIHLEQDRNGVRLRYRIDGVCKEPNVEWLKKKLQEMPGAIISRIKVLSNLDIAEKRLPQDGVFRVSYNDRESDRKFDLDFRVATCPAIVGENVTIRILDPRKAKVGLESLNHSEQVLTPLKRLFKSSAGMILVSGPTGSGKSSTLYAALRYIYNPGIKIITAEDPIEYSFPGIMQTQIKPKINLTFARLLRSFLRLDPDVILVGEIRDEETAGIAFDAAQTGHLLLSTIHTNDAVSAVTRLRDLKVEHNQIGSSLLGVLAQRLVRRICDKCKRPYQPPRDEWRLFFNRLPEDLTFYRGVGCRACGYTGFNGRTLISELFEVNRDIALALSRGATESEIKQLAFESGMQSMIEDGLTKLDQTTLSELIRTVPIEMIKQFAARRQGLDDCGTSMTEGRIPPELVETVQLTVADPEGQQSAVEGFFQAYRRLASQAGSPEAGGDVKLFKDFVKTWYERIVHSYPCRKVKFEARLEGSRVELFATPVKE